MGFDSNGNWSSDFFPVTDRDNSVPILASKFQTLIQTNLKQSFENCILRDGTGKPTANINFNSQKITNLADGTNSNDAVNKSQLDSAVAVSAGEEQQGTIEISTEAEALAGTDDTTAMTPAKVKAVIDTLATSTRFCVNSGNASAGGPDLLAGVFTGSLDFNVDDGTQYKPLVATTADGNSFTLTSISSVDVTSLPDSTYNVFVDEYANVYLYANTVYRQPSEPSSMNTNDIWFNTCEPFKAYIKTVSDLEETGLVQLPHTVKIASNVISDIYRIANFNDNGAANDAASLFEKIAPAIAPDIFSGTEVTLNTRHTADTNGWLEINSRTSGWNNILYIGSSTYPDSMSARFDKTYTHIFIAKGDVYRIVSESSNLSARFFPCRGISGITTY